MTISNIMSRKGPAGIQPERFSYLGIKDQDVADEEEQKPYRSGIGCLRWSLLGSISSEFGAAQSMSNPEVKLSKLQR